MKGILKDPPEPSRHQDKFAFRQPHANEVVYGIVAGTVDVKVGAQLLYTLEPDTVFIVKGKPLPRAEQKLVYTLEPNQILGQIASSNLFWSSATAIAKTRCQVVIFNQHHFDL